AARGLAGRPPPSRGPRRSARRRRSQRRRARGAAAAPGTSGRPARAARPRIDRPPAPPPRRGAPAPRRAGPEWISRSRSSRGGPPPRRPAPRGRARRRVGERRRTPCAPAPAAPPGSRTEAVAPGEEPSLDAAHAVVRQLPEEREEDDGHDHEVGPRVVLTIDEQEAESARGG